ncbi:MAG: O-methyltransferase [Treponema sp.]|nr:O-methyltransferase [Spirochaetia bacterium]MDD7534114.1 O-methyltransferase [Treponema sp.]MDY3721064.1 O-methyltransferase [Treponema sp.]MDY5758979.1 O-methyltransferase [Treponema sp.]MDY5816501.1 O-methyltransferase [Treponema sp.]
MDNLLSIKAYASREAVPIMQDEGCDFICDYIKEHSCKNILEIGTAIGYSSIRFAGLADDIKVTTIELDIDRHLKAVENFKSAGLSDRITAIHADALTCPLEGLFDLIFIDAAKAQYIKFFEKYKENLAPGGVIISDNLSFHGMVDDLSLTHNYSTKKLVKKIQKYAEYLRTNQEFETTFYEVGDRIAVSKRR